LRRQALAASKIEDKTHYVIFDGHYPATDPSVYLRHMSVQVDNLQCLLDNSDNPSVQWEAITRQFPALDDIVDRGSKAENLSNVEMQNRLIQLYRKYVTEWDDVKSELSRNLLISRSQQSLLDKNG
jgi:hypothetical protein